MSSPIPVISQEDLENIRLITTSCGFVLKGCFRPQDADVSLKLLTGNNIADTDLRDLLNEAAKARCIQSERILPVTGFYQSPRLLGIVTEWMCGGSLHALIHQQEIYSELPLCLITKIMLDVAEGLSHLHNLSPPLLHQGLKPSNILLDPLYRAKISDYGLTHWRKQHLRSVSVTACNGESNDLVYLSPETLLGEDPKTSGDVYSYGMTLWECLSRQRPFEGKTTIPKVLTGVSNGLRPRTDEEVITIPATVPQRINLVQLIDLCWHSDPDTRPAITECVYRLQKISDKFTSEMIAHAVYSLMQAKEEAVNASKASLDPHSVRIDIQNLEVFYGQANGKVLIKPSIPERTQCETLINVGSQDYTRPENVQPLRSANSSSPYANHGQGKPMSCSRGPALQSSFSIPPTDNSRTGTGEAGLHRLSLGSVQWLPGIGDTVPLSLSSSHHTDASAEGICRRGSCCQILTSQRETILSCVTEGCLNKILDSLQSQRMLAKADYEQICSYPTLTGRARALLDTSVCLGEGVAHIVVRTLLSNKCQIPIELCGVR